MPKEVNGYMTEQGQFYQTEPEAIYMENAEKFYTSLQERQGLSDSVLMVLHAFFLEFKGELRAFLGALDTLGDDPPQLYFEPVAGTDYKKILTIKLASGQSIEIEGTLIND